MYCTIATARGAGGGVAAIKTKATEQRPRTRPCGSALISTLQHRIDIRLIISTSVEYEWLSIDGCVKAYCCCSLAVGRLVGPATGGRMRPRPSARPQSNMTSEKAVLTENRFRASHGPIMRTLSVRGTVPRTVRRTVHKGKAEVRQEMRPELQKLGRSQ